MHFPRPNQLKFPISLIVNTSNIIKRDKGRNAGHKR